MEEQPGLFRTFNPLSPTTRQTTRALQEIQAQRLSGIFAIDDMRITPNNQTRITPNNSMLTPPAAGDHGRPVANNVLRPTNPQTRNNPNNHMNILNIFNNLNNDFDHNNTTPTNGTPLLPERRRLSGNFEHNSDHHEQSPDEAVIQARGRRSIPLTYSPDINHTPLR